MNKTHIDYERLQADTLLLVDKLQNSLSDTCPSWESTNLICLSRGGLFVGGLVSYALNMKKVYNISVESYEEDSMDSNVEVKLLTPFPVLDPSQKYLVVDDLNDTSETYRFISRQMIKYDCPDWNFATVYHKQRKGNDVPDFYGTLMPADSWIVFPWDRLR